MIDIRRMPDIDPTDIDPTCSFEIIVVRGDLYSDSGYGRATRALADILAGFCRHLFGVSLHEHAARRQNRFDFPVVSDMDLVEDERFAGCTIINICLPDTFIAVPGARNIGYFFWETEQFPPRAFWKARMLLMDELWAPSHWQSEVLRAQTGRRVIPVIPWPQDRETAPPARPKVLGEIKAHAPQSLAQLENYLLRSAAPGSRDIDQYAEEAEHAAGRSLRFDPLRSPTLLEVLARDGVNVLAVQTDAPRKGLPLLLTGWLLFKQTPEGRHAKLIIKMSSIDVSMDVFRLHFHMSVAARRPMRRLDIEEADIYFVYERFSNRQLRALMAAGDVFVSATMGEGFGGPIAEAFLEGVPVVCPYHTSCKDLLGPDYPLAVATDPHRQKLWQNIDVYSPASVWNVVDDDALVECLRRVARMTRAERQTLGRDARSRLLDAVGVASVRDRLATALLRTGSFVEPKLRTPVGRSAVPGTVD